MALTSKDYKGVIEIINLIYSIPDKSAMILTVWERLQKLVPFTGAVFIPIDYKTHNFQPEGHVLLNQSPEAIYQFCSYYATLHPFVIKGWHLNRVNEAIKITEAISASRLIDTEYSSDYQSRFHVFYDMGMSLGSQGDPVGAIGLHRPRLDREFSDKDKEIMNLLIPHLSNALHSTNLMETIASSLGGGVIFIGSDKNSIYMNEEARMALNGRPVSVIHEPGLENAPVFFQSKRGTYRIRTVKGKGKIRKIIILEPLLSEQSLHPKLISFGLSRREEEITTLAIQGFSNKEIAGRLFICEQTVKDHLQDVFEKVEVHSRSELTAKALGLRP
jgi:DNA-binding CsgD family transcriptional regulator